jgi:3-hydroxy-D-aspartate aldolase
MSLDEVDTPALLIDLDALEENIRRVANAVHGTSVRVRPHAKTHKCPEIARRQIDAGAVGLCCQKVSEAEAMVAGGVQDVIVTNEVVDPRKLGRLVSLARRARIGVCCDDPAAVDILEGAAAAGGVTLRVLVELEVGGNRCGVRPGADAVALAELIDAKPHLSFVGLQAYNGPAQHLKTIGERRASTAEAVENVKQTLEQLARAGLGCETVGGAGTGTFRLEASSGIFNELQVGSYVFMDADYARIGGEDEGPFSDFDHSLFVLTAVMSVAAQDWAVCDAGTKSVLLDRGMPIVVDRPDLAYVAGGGDEHGKLMLGAGAGPKLGDRLRLIPPHCDPTVNLHDWFVCYRGHTVEDVWPIAARGGMF